MLSARCLQVVKGLSERERERERGAERERGEKAARDAFMLVIGPFRTIVEGPLDAGGVLPPAFHDIDFP